MRTAPGWTLICTSLVVSVVACGGDDNPINPDAPTSPPDAMEVACTPTPPALQPGPLADPLAFPLPAECVVGGLRDIPGRWFVRNPDSNFSYLYPKFEGDCTAGFKRANARPEDTDLSDGQIFHHWSDGTRVMTRAYYVFPGDPGDPDFEYVSLSAACMLPNGSLAAVNGFYTTDFGEEFTPMAGQRFGLKDEPALGLDLVGELGVGQGGAPLITYNLVVDVDHVYTVGPLGFDVIDVSAPAAPIHVAHIDGAWNDIKVVHGGGRTVAFLSPLYDEGTAAIDVSAPASPEALTQIGEFSHSVFVQTRGAQTLLYLATYTDRVPVFDVTNPLVPLRLGEATVPGPAGDGVHDLFAAGNMIYTNYTTAGFVAFDVAGGLDNAVERGRIPTSYSHASWAGMAGGRPIILHGDEGMTPDDGGSFLRVLEGDPTAATFASAEIGRYQSRPEVGIHNIVLDGNKAYIAYYQDGVRVVDLSDPTNPTEVAHYNTWNNDTAPGGAFEGAIGIKVSGGLIFVADTLRGLIILDEP